MVSCPKCGKETPSDAVLCPYCGERMHLATTEFSPLTLSAMSKLKELKNPGVAALLSAIFGLVGLWGIGHFYVGKIVRGIGFLIAGLILIGSIAFLSFSLGLLAIFSSIYPPFSSMEPAFGLGAIGIVIILVLIYIIGFFWQINNAYNLAKNLNIYYQQNDTAPW